MEVSDLRLKLESYREELKKNGGIVVAGPGGPITLPIIDAIVATIEQQEKRLSALEKARA